MPSLDDPTRPTGRPADTTNRSQGRAATTPEERA